MDNIKVDEKLNDKQKKRAKEVQEKLRKQTGGIRIIQGVFGDMENCDGIVEKVITPEHGGTFTKVYGCDYLFKGFPPRNTIEGMGLAKSMISRIPQWIIAKSFILKSALGLLWLVSRKRFYHYLKIYCRLLWRHTVRRVNMPEERYNKPMLTLKRAVKASLERRLKLKGYSGNLMESDRDVIRSADEELSEAIYYLVEFIAFFLEHDNAYRFRVQDIAEEVDKYKLRQDVGKELNRLLEIMKSREQSRLQYDKYDMTQKILNYAMKIPRIREVVRTILLEVKWTALGLDENDWYFCLRRADYNFRGIKLTERLKEKEKIDKEKGHITTQLYLDEGGTAKS